MDRIPRLDFSTWPEQARRYALSLVEILNNDVQRARLSEYTSILKLPVPQSTDPDLDEEIRTLRRGSIFALPAYGAEGLNVLYQLVTLPRPHRSQSALYYGSQALLHVTLNRDISFHIENLCPYLEEMSYTSLVQDIYNTHKNLELQREARHQLSRIIYSFTSEPSDRHVVGYIISAIAGFIFIGDSQTVSALNLMLEIVVQGTLNISDTLCHQLEVLIGSNFPERIYQEFFEKCPAFIDPLASSIVERQHMGEMWRTDFVIRRLDDQYIFVEIEKPQDSPFTSYPHPSAALSHALGQVLNWFVWVEDNIAYAQSHGFPGIHSPRGVVVIGRNSDLTPNQLRLLKTLNDNLHPRIHIQTYDDVLVNARNIVRNLIAR